MYGCINTYFYVRRTSTEFLYVQIPKNFKAERPDAYGEKKQCTYGLSYWFEVGQNQLKARQSRKKQAYIGPFEPKSVRTSACGQYSRAPGVGFVLVSSM